MNFRKLVIASAVLLGACAATPDPGPATPEWRLVVHGGAGVITREGMSPEKEAAYTAALETALEAGAAVLRNGGSALDAVEAAVIPMEDDPLFNSGHGAVFTAAGTHELDASI
ncbi:MAG TPA: isoaspartyl peptidase/L-asparaginase, partial [Alphaproteobacteria bacterium]|nr:isoaspartyl peptidase/L-asparaginase [Alphaproteobacteria bacterium]